MYGIVQMVVSVVLLGCVLGTILDGFSLQRAAMLKAQMLEKQLDAQLLASLDVDGNGIDQAEFVLVGAASRSTERHGTAIHHRHLSRTSATHVPTACPCMHVRRHMRTASASLCLHTQHRGMCTCAERSQLLGLASKEYSPRPLVPDL